MSKENILKRLNSQKKSNLIIRPLFRILCLLLILALGILIGHFTNQPETNNESFGSDNESITTTYCKNIEEDPIKIENNDFPFVKK